MAGFTCRQQHQQTYTLTVFLNACINMGIHTYLVLVLRAVNTNLYVILSSYTYTLCVYVCIAGVGYSIADILPYLKLKKWKIVIYY